MPFCSGKTWFSVHHRYNGTANLWIPVDDADFLVQPVIEHTCFYRTLSKYLL